MSEILKRLVTDFNIHTLYALSGSIGVFSALLFFRWVYNKRKFNKLAHQIPASVVKNYLDSIIQNSNSLKSSLFRGELGMGDGVPSVMPVEGLSSSTPVQGGVDQNQFNQKVAEIAALKAKLSEKESLVSELESKLANASSGSAPAPVDTSAKDAEIAKLKGDIQKLQADLEAAKASAGSGGGDNSEVEGQLAAVTKERDELKEKLQEYEIIEDDLANLKRLQQENAELRAALEGKGGAPAPSEPAPAAGGSEPEPIAEATAEAAPVEAPASEAPAESVEPEPIAEAVSEPAGEAPPEGGDPKLEGEEKSAEDLLSEFEKMLG